jgi:hypothetical protein
VALNLAGHEIILLLWIRALRVGKTEILWCVWECVVSDSTDAVRGLEWLTSLPQDEREWLIAHHPTAVLVECGRLLQDPQHTTADFDRLLLEAQYLAKRPLYDEIEEAMSRPLASGRLELIPVEDWDPEA